MREVFPVGDPQDVHGLLGMEHLGKLVTSLRSRADLIVIQSPVVSESAESYMVCAVADRTLLVAEAGSSADSVLAARDQMERVGVSLLGVAFVERPGRRRAEPGSNDRTATASGPDARERPGPTPSATWATSRNGAAGSRLNGHGRQGGRRLHRPLERPDGPREPSRSRPEITAVTPCRPEVTGQPGMIKRIAPAIDRWFEGRALMDGAAGSALVVGAMTIVLTVLALVGSRVPGGLGALLLLVVVGAIIVAACLRYPPLAVVVMLGAMFLRLALPHLIVADPFLIAYALVLASAAVWMWRQRQAVPRVTFVEVAMVLYILWCYGSMVLPHQYPPVAFPLNGSLTPVPRFIEVSTDIPFTMYLLGRRLFTRESAVRFVLWSILGFAAYSTMVSIFQFYAPSLVWPRYIVDAPAWPGRAIGVFNQPVGNGMVLITGFVIAIVLASDRGEPAMATGPAVAVRAAVHLGHLPHPHARDLPGLRACADPRCPPGAGSPRRIRRPDRRDHPLDRLELVDLHQL